MATETPDQSASLAEVSRSFFTDPAGLTQSKNEYIDSSRPHRMCVKPGASVNHLVVMEK